MSQPSNPQVRGLTRWESTEDARGYGQRFAELFDTGEDIYGEARLADALAPRGAHILDAGCGMGRTGGYLRSVGHSAFGVDLDTDLLAQAARNYPDLPTLEHRIDLLTASALHAAGFPTSFDLICCVGNVMILSEPGGEVRLLEAMRRLLRGNGKLLVGFHTDATPPGSLEYSRTDFERDAHAAGLRVSHVFSGYDLAPFDPCGNYVVAICTTPPLLAA